MADAPTKPGAHPVIAWAVMLVLLALVWWLLVGLNGGGDPAVRTQTGIVTDPLLGPELNSLADAVDALPGDEGARAALGRAYEANELYEPAAATWLQLIEANPDEWIWRYRLAMTTERLGNLDAAIVAMSEAARLAPTDAADAHWRLALWLVDAGRPEEAREFVQRAEAIDAHAMPVRVAMVRLALAENRAAEAERMTLEYRLTSSLSGGYGWQLLGRALRRQGRIDEARDAWSRAGDTRPRFSDQFSDEMNAAVGGLRAIKLAATAHVQSGRWTDVLQATARALRHDPDDLVQRRLHAIARLQIGDAVGAEQELMALLQDSPEASTWSALGSARLKLMQQRDDVTLAAAALEAAMQGLALDPDNRRLLMVRGRAEGSMGQPEAAMRSFRSAWDLDRSREVVLVLAMTAIMEADTWADGLDMAEALYHAQPAHPLAGAGYALGLARTGRTREARAVLSGLTGRRIHAALRRQAQAALDELTDGEQIGAN